MNFRISQEMKINGVTALDNLFVSEFMLGAPGDFVKVYIYTLMLCTTGMKPDEQTIAKDLSISEEATENAFKYWERKGLLKRTAGGYSFESPKSVVACNAVSKGDALSVYKDFVAALYELMPGREITAGDMNVAYDWIEIYGMSSDCVLAMVSYAVNHKYKAGKRVSFTTLNKMALDWSEKGIKTRKQAEKYIDMQIIMNSDAKAILNHLGQYRNPTVDEYKLLEKWEKEYGFSKDALLACCAQMVYSKNPSFALLDNIVEKYHEMGISSPEDIEKAKHDDDKMFNTYREIIQRSGGVGSATQAQKELIDSLIDKGMGEQALLYICDYTTGMDKKGLSHVVKLAEELLSVGITDDNDVCEELENRKQNKEKVKEFLEAAGFSRNPTKADIAMYTEYMDALKSHEIMLKAAGFAFKAKNKTEHLAALLEDWKNKGVKSVKEAEDIIPVPKKKDDDRNQYIKGDRTYSGKELFDIIN